MWLYTDKGAISAVADRDNSEFIWVRSRNIKALETFSDRQPLIKPNADYRYRVRLTRSEFSEALGKYVDGMKYDNFKDHVGRVSRELLPAYYGVYNATLDLELVDERDSSMEAC